MSNLQDSPNQPSPAALNALRRAQERNRELERFIKWEDELFSNPKISGNHKLAIRATRRAVQRAQTRDEQGRARINLTTIAGQIGVSTDTMSRGLKFLEQCGVIPDRALVPEVQENGERWTRHYIALNEDLLNRPKEIQPPTPRNHGGIRYTCPKCGSDKVKIRKHITLICQCGHISTIEDSEHDQEPSTQEPPASNASFCEQDRNLQGIIKPVSPPNRAAECSNDVEHATLDDEQQAPLGQQGEQDDLHAAAKLLLAIAGQAEEHIEMSRRGEKKYYTVSRPLTLDDLLDHLQGGKARGALCSYEGNLVRALCWDTDDSDLWEMFKDIARRLAEAGYLPILEPSPVRGGHLWIIYDNLVDVSAARQHIYAIAPELLEIVEYWPGPPEAKRWNKVRLPGGKYVRPGISAWCQLVSVTDGEVSGHGTGAATLLLTHQTPSTIVPATRPASKSEPESTTTLDAQDAPTQHVVEQPAPVTIPMVAAGAAGTQPNTDDPGNQDTKSKMLPGQQDLQWQARYNTPEGKRLWFAFPPSYVAAWWNEHHSIDELLPSERSGYGLASWRSERTASVAKDGERWADFGAAARRGDGSPDTGDALELQVRLSQTPKPEVMREAARELLQEARQDLEQAARSGAALPAWLEEIITDAGRDHYAKVASEAGHLIDAASSSEKRSVTKIGSVLRNGDQASPAPAISSQDNAQGGLTGFSSFSNEAQQSNSLSNDNRRQLRASALAVPSSLIQEQDSAEVLAADIGAEIGAPCQRCGCTLYYRNSTGDEMCHQCYPRPAKYGRLSDEQHARLRALFPRSV